MNNLLYTIIDFIDHKVERWLDRYVKWLILCCVLYWTYHMIIFIKYMR